jgi:hypothetical protein
MKGSAKLLAQNAGYYTSGKRYTNNTKKAGGDES